MLLKAKEAYEIFTSENKNHTIDLKILPVSSSKYFIVQ